MKLIVGLGNPGVSYLMTRHNIGFMLADALATAQAQAGAPALTDAGEAFVLKKNCKSRILKKSFILRERPAKKDRKTDHYRQPAGSGKGGEAPAGTLDIGGAKAKTSAITSGGALQKRSLCASSEEGKEISFLVAKPQTYMNLSGEAVAALLAYYKISLSDLLVIQDDVDQEFMRLKFQKNRGAGGHKGIQSIHDCLKTADYARLKLGVGRPLSPSDSSESLSQTKEGERGGKTPQAGGRTPSVSDYVLSSFSEEEIPPLKEFLERAADAVFFFLESGFERAAGRFNGRV